ncbi:HD domain-containing protein [Rugosimonospora acidiphila]|uniref:HD domain-containing protein n=1 Tax=Rugosimonospora acidiphila TaxID=556531 RepID=A0ABP9RWB8_9ACTN
MTRDFIPLVADLFAGEGAQDYLGEPVTVSVHLRQAAALAEAAEAGDAPVAAALLHDVGHLIHGLTGDLSGRDLMAGTDNRHGYTGAAWLGRWLGPAVTEPVRLHVEAKRYLCAVEPAYHAGLSDASKYTLELQGGPMTTGQARTYEALPYAADAVALRRWDDLAKDPSREAPEFDHFVPVLRRLLSASA